MATLGIAALIAAPVLVVLGFLATPNAAIWRHLVETVLGRYLLGSLQLMAAVAGGTLVLGVSGAWLVTMCRFPGRRLFEWALLLPLAMPAYVIAYTYTGLLDYPGPVQSALRGWFGWSRADYWFPQIRSYEGAALMLSLVLYPYVYMLARSAFLAQSVCALEASRVLGAGPWRAFYAVALPLARPAIVAGVALALMETLADFGTVEYFAVDSFTTGIFRIWYGLGDVVAAGQLGAVLLLTVLGLLALERASRGQARFHHTTGRYRRLTEFHLRGGRAALAIILCVLPILLGFITPVAVLLNWASLHAEALADPRFWTHAGNSAVLAAVTALAAGGLALILAYGQRLGRSPIIRIAVRIAGSGYAVPGAVIAIGVLVPAAAFDRILAAALRDGFGVNVGLVFSGSIAIVIYAYLVRFLAVAHGTVESALAKVTPSMDGAARTLGLGPGAVLRRVHLPIIHGGVLTAMLLVFVDVMKELPATLILRPFNFDTLAIRTYQLAGDERLPEAALPALAIVAAGLLPVILLSRAISRSRPGRDEDV